jgi:vitamin B12 transporter
MLTKLKTVVFGFFVLASFIASAQKKDSVRMLSDVIIEQSRLNSYAISQYALPVDSMTRALASGGSLADMLRKSGFGHIRSYGPGGLASASLRGTGSSHTAVLWNGINLISPLNGQLDLSLVPVGFIDDASIQSGGSASLYGNGSIGGTIQLNNRASFNEGLKLKTFSNIGSFGSYYEDLSVSISGKKFISSTKVFLNQAKNDFEFVNRNVFPTQVERRDHTAYDQKGILQQNYWQLSTQHLLTFKFWAQDNLYEIPSPTTASKKSEATERNKFYRTVVGWNYNRNAFDLNYQGAFVRHDLNYTDPVTNLTSPSTFNTFINNLELNFSFKKASSLTTGVNYTWEQGIVDAFGSDVPIRNRIAFFGAFKWKPGKRWDIVTSLREEIVNGKTTPAAPSITAKVRLSKTLDIFSNLSRNYRIPTFNDLYWKGVGGLGNPDLKPEISIGGEVGFNITSIQTEPSDILLSLKTAVFSNHVDNWILWSPVNSLFWSPQNIKKVWSRGIETTGSAHKQIHNVNLELTAHYSFTQATNQDIYEIANPNELDKQLILTPIHEASATLRAIWKGYYLNVVNSFIGKQYTDTDNTEFGAMKSYNITNIGFGKPILSRKIKATISGELNNIFNTEYQSRPGYPMPGRNFKIGLTINFSKPINL